jgi:hypothetical protein
MSDAQFRNEWSYTSSSHICLHGMNRDTFTFIMARVIITFWAYAVFIKLCSCYWAHYAAWFRNWPGHWQEVY